MSDFNLYEFPKDHVGRKTYVSVPGHSRSIPDVYLGYGANGRRHVLPEYGGDPLNFAVGDAPMVMRDMGEYRSPLEANTVITSRSQHREHMRRHGVVEVGTQKLGTMGGGERASMGRAGQDIARALQGR